MRSSGATYFGFVLSVVMRTNSTIACFAVPSLHDGSASFWGNVNATARTAKANHETFKAYFTALDLPMFQAMPATFFGTTARSTRDGRFVRGAACDGCVRVVGAVCDRPQS